MADRIRAFGLVSLLTAMATCAGCGGGSDGPQPPSAAGPASVPRPLNLLLPQEIRIHAFTGVRTLDAATGSKGLEVRIEALDAYQDTTKAFGDYRFELYSFRANSSDPKGKLLSTWEVPLTNPKENLLHWDQLTRAYVFKLELYKTIKAGDRYVLVTVFSSPYTKRLFAQRVISGQ